MAQPPKWEDLPEVLKPEDIQAYLRYESIQTVYSLLRRGKIRAIGGNQNKSNRLWRVTKDALRQFQEGA